MKKTERVIRSMMRDKSTHETGYLSPEDRESVRRSVFEDSDNTEVTIGYSVEELLMEQFKEMLE
jgi:hypothetical protein